MIILKQSTAVTLLIGPFVDSTDGNTAETGLTIAQADVRLSKNGGNMAQKNEATSCTHDELGYYTCPLDTTDTGTLGQLKVMVHESGALPVWLDCLVVTANVYDTLCSTDQLDVNVTNIEGSDATDQINAACDTALTDYDAATGAELAALNDPSAADIADAVWDEAQADHVAAGSFGLIASEIATIDGIVDNILLDTAEIGVAGAGLTALPWNAAWDAEVQSECADALTAYDPPTEAEMNARTLAAADYFDVTSDTVTVGTSNDKTGYRLSATGVDDVLDEVVESTLTLRQIVRILLAGLAGQSTGGGTTSLTFRDVADTKARITATVDANQNRTGITLDGE